MGDENAASTLVLVAAILQLLISLYNMVSGVFSALTILLFLFDPLMMLLIGWLIFFSMIFSFVIGVVGIIFSILWFNWRHSPGEHKTGLIVSGVLGIFLGVIPGILALIGGAIATSPTEYISFEPVKTMPYRTEKRCSRCGAEATADDEYCWRCGTRL